MEVIAQGAESILYRVGDKLVKHRVKKRYRINDIDDLLRKSRTRSEAKIIKKAGELINTPKLLKIDEQDNKILMSFIDGEVLRDVINDLSRSELIMVCNQIGESIAKLHNASIIHGDLTTSNMILKDELVYFIDFGLSEVSKKIENKAVDLRVLKEALNSKHYLISNKVWKLITEQYVRVAIDGCAVIDRLKSVELRGRYKKSCQ